MFTLCLCAFQCGGAQRAYSPITRGKHWRYLFSAAQFSADSANQHFKHVSSGARRTKVAIADPGETTTIEEARRLVQAGLAIQGRLHTLSRTVAYVEHPLDKQRVIIFGSSNRNQALNGDIVFVQLLPIGQWKVQGSEAHPMRPTVPPAADESSDDCTADGLDSAEDSLESEFSKIPCVEGSTTQNENDRLRSKYYPLYSAQSLNQLRLSSNLQYWPSDIPQSIRLSDIPPIHMPLPSPLLMRTGFVIAIGMRNLRSRRLIGQVAFFRPRTGRINRHTVPLDVRESVENAVCLFLPNTISSPPVKLDVNQLPQGVLENRALGQSTNYVCLITGWNTRMNLPMGIISEQLGNMNELEPATKELLLHYGFEDKEFEPLHLVGLPSSPEEFEIPPSAYLKRRDFRSCCIFSIDPSSAKDIDDALHIKQIGSDLYEVGIHIADVSYFVKPGSALDQEAASRATSLYLVQRVIPMLPAILSEHLCSLQPCADRLAFSVVLTVRSSGEIVETWFGRSIIRSRLKLTYEQALAVLNASQSKDTEEVNRLFSSLISPPESPFKPVNVCDSLVKLNSIAHSLREQRLKSGALTLQKAKIEFDLPPSSFSSYSLDDQLHPPVGGKLNDRTIWPRGYSIQVPILSHQLIEEWMLAANQAVAKRLFQAFMKRTNSSLDDSVVTDQNTWHGILLRRHDGPLDEKIEELKSILQAADIHLSDGSSSSISNALRNYNEKLEQSGRSEEERMTIMDTLSHLVYVRMQMASYFSLDDLILLDPSLTDAIKEDNLNPITARTWHFGLSVPLYTHFTSPIRRYADLLVHRQLASILHEEKLTRSTQTHDKSAAMRIRRFIHSPSESKLSLAAEWCNHQRMMSRRAQEASQRLFLTACLRDCGLMNMNGTVLHIDKNSIKIVLSTFGLIVKCSLKQFLRRTLDWQVDLRTFPSTADRTRSAGQCPHISVRWSAAEEDSTAELVVPTQETSIQLLSVLPCVVFCQSDRLELNAEFNPPSRVDNIASLLCLNPFETTSPLS